MSHLNFNISVVICTYNRCDILNETLTHLFTQVEEISKVEVLVVDNNSKDNTSVVIKNLQAKYDNLKYVFEKKQGLSVARNTGFRKSSNEYILYLDDDALAYKSIFIEINKVFQSFPNIQALGGVYYPWYRFGEPKWYKAKYASRTFKHQGVKPLEGSETWSGGVMLISKSALERFPFREDLGMTGNTTFYGEETELQYRLIENDIPVYGTNDIFIDHIVQPYKLNLNWFFKEKKALAESMYRIDKTKTNWFVRVVKGLLLMVILTIKGIVLNMPKILFSSNYYKENFAIDTFVRPYKWWIYTKNNFIANDK